MQSQSVRSSSVPSNATRKGLIQWLNCLPWPQKAVGVILLLAGALTVLALTQGPRPDPYRADEFPAWNWWRYPTERNAFARLPYIQGDLNAIASTDGGRSLWIAGSGGLILCSVDGGMTWAVQDGGTKEDLVSITFLDGGVGWAVSRNGTLLNTTDRGKTWADRTPERAPVPSGTGDAGTRAKMIEAPGRLDLFRPARRDPGMEQLAALHAAMKDGTIRAAWFVDADRGWAVGDAGRIVATEDGGATWLLQKSPVTTSLTAVTFLNPSAGWATGTEGKILRTQDGGRHWEYAQIPTHAFTSVQFVDWGRGWVAGKGGLFRTTNGADWAMSRLPDERDGVAFTPELASLYFADRDRGWAVANDALLITTDGGQSWKKQSGELFQGVRAVRIVDERRGWAVGVNGAVLSTDDAGVTWRSVAACHLVAADFVDPDHGWAVGDRGTILATDDGGRTWATPPSGTTTDLRAVDFVDATTGWAVGGSSDVLTTGDGGASWKALATPSRDGIDAVFFLDARRGWVQGRDPFLGTRDGGRNWTPGTGPRGPRGTMYWLDAGHGWAATGSSLSRTSDGGETWTEVLSETGSRFSSIFFRDPAIGWATTAAGEILKSTSGGNDWSGSYRNSGPLRSVHFGPGGAGCAAGDGARLLCLRTGGLAPDRWEMKDLAEVSPTEDLVAVRFADADRASVVSSRGTVLGSADGGRTWAVRSAPYRRYPAPWYYAACFLLAAVSIVLARLPAAKWREADEGIADSLVSDRPLERAAEDRLDFAPTAAGIAHFLRNENTEAPLVLAVTGTWGSGKTSLMNLVRENLKRSGFFPVWFNAWHHQKEEHLLAALLENVRLQAIPPLIHPLNWLFRAKLLRLRLGRYAAMLVTIGVLACFIYAFAPTVADRLHGLRPVATATAAPAKEGDEFPIGDMILGVLGRIPRVAGLLPILIPLLPILRRTLKAFGIRPAQLIVTAGAISRDLDAQAGFRHRFAKEFREVTAALPRRLVLFVDDLDRCRTEQVVEVLEAINFLVSSGDCFIVLGIDRERVERCVGLAFKDVAAELLTVDAEREAKDTNAPPPQPTEPTTPGPAAEVEARRRRVEYARHYLEKIIHIEVPVPRPPKPDRLLNVIAKAEVPLNRWAARIDGSVTWLRENASFGIAFLVMALLLLMPFLHPSPVPERAAGPVAPAVETRETTAQGPGTAAGPTPATQSSGATEADDPSKPGGLDAGQVSPRGVLPAAVAFGVIFAAALGWALLSEALRTVRDSPDFRKALAAWERVLLAKHPTPRRMKRYLNRTRFYAMVEARPRPELTLGQRIATRTRRIPANEREPEVPDEMLVALSAIEFLNPDWLWLELQWEAVKRNEFTVFAPGYDSPKMVALHDEGEMIRDAIREHRRSLGWPTPGELDAYRDRLCVLSQKASFS